MQYLVLTITNCIKYFNVNKHYHYVSLCVMLALPFDTTFLNTYLIILSKVVFYL